MDGEIISRMYEDIENKAILITGAHGFIGFHLSRRLAAQNFNLILVDNLLESELDQNFIELMKKTNVRYICSDLSSFQSCQTLPDVDIVFHLAALNGTGNFYSKPFDVLKHSSMPTINLLERFRFVDRFFYAGSSESYAGGVNLGFIEVPTHENVPLVIEDTQNPRWSYACAKTLGEMACMSAESQFGSNIVIGRFHNVFGPRMGINHVIPDFVERALKNEFILHGALNTRSFIYISDAVDDIIKLVSLPLATGVFNIGSDQEISMIELAEQIISLMGLRNVTISQACAPIGSVMRRIPDLAKLNGLLGHRNRVSLEDGLKSTLNWYKNKVVLQA